jgi:pimeloyl-ACP methyl ester carboxylesterase
VRDDDIDGVHRRHLRVLCQDPAVGTVTVDGQRFEYEIVGDGVPVVAVQNVQAPLRMWPTPGETNALLEAGFSLVAYRHLGTTDTIEGIAADVGRLIDHLEIGPVCLWGYSQGAMTAQELALARPDIVRSAVMMATRARLSAYDRFRYEAVEPVIAESEVGMMLALMMNYGLDALCDDDLFTQALEAQRSVGEVLDDDFRQRANHAGATYGLGRLAALRATQVPCMVVAFAQDGNIPPPLNREVADAIPECEYVEIAGAGHNGGISHRRQVRDHVLPFLRRTAGLTG